jgi:hypothetical protein
VSFLHDDLHTVPITGEFDAVVGRLVLLYLPHPDVVLRRFASLVRKGGIVAMMEYEMAAAGSLPPTALSEQVTGWVTESFRRSGLDASLGARLTQVMRRAGFDEATMLGVQGYCEAGDRDGPRMAAGIIRTLLPVLHETGVATPDEVDIDTLEDRIAQDCIDHDLIFKFPTLVGAWARVA